MAWSSVVPQGSTAHGAVLCAVRGVHIAPRGRGSVAALEEELPSGPGALPADGHVHIRIGSRVWTAGRRATSEEPWDDVFAVEVCLHQRMLWTVQVDVFGSRGILQRHAHLGRVDMRLADLPGGAPDAAGIVLSPSWHVLRARAHAYASLVALQLPHIVA